MVHGLESAAGFFRLATAFVAFSAVTLVLQSPDVSPSATIELDHDDSISRGGAIWSVRTDGWVLELDVAEVALPRTNRRRAAVPEMVPRVVRLSPFDHVIKRHAGAHDFDWRLIAAIIFEESRFEPSSISPKGAFGLMQVRQIAADAVGEYRFKLPEDNIRAGVRYLAHLEEIFAELPDAVRENFMLAGYNAGPGHVRDAQTLARRLGYDPDRWEGGIRETLPLLEERRYYESVPLGYAQGRSVVRYVELVLHRLRHYQRMTAAATLEGLASMAPDQPVD
jgi:soluble lytic murein transglycosylase-like protein